METSMVKRSTHKVVNNKYHISSYKALPLIKPTFNNACSNGREWLILPALDISPRAMLEDIF